MYCNKCGKEVGVNDKFCNHCGAINNQDQTTNYNNVNVKTKKKLYQQWWFWLIIVIVVIGIVGSSGNSGENSISTGGTTNANTTTKTKDTLVNSTKTKFKVGETYKDNYISIRYVSLDSNFTEYSKYVDVKSGYKIIKVDFEFHNIGTTDTTVSSFDFTCYADGYSCEDFWNVDNATFTDTLSSNKKTKGSVYFEVPKDAKEIILEYETNWLTSEKIEFIVK